MTNLRRQFGFIQALLAVAGMLTVGCARAQTEFVSPTGAYLASRHAIYQGDMVSRVEFLTAALKASPDNGYLLSQTHYTLVSTGRVSEAVPVAERLHALDLANSLAAVTLLVDALKRDDPDGASEALGLLPDGDYGALLAPLAKAWLAVARNDHEAALMEIGPFTQNDGFDGVRAYHSALIHDVAGDSVSAERDFIQAGAGQPGASWEMARAYGGFLERLGRKDDARGVYRRFMDSHPDRSWFEADLERLLSGGEAPAPVHADLAIVDAFAAVARHLTAESRTYEAVCLLNQAAFLAPNDDRIRFTIGKLLAGQRRFVESADAYGLVAEHSPVSWDARLARARTLERMERAEEAVSTLEAMAGERPGSAGPLIAIGDIMRSQGRWHEAVESYDKALERLAPDALNRPALLYRLGIALERSGDWDRAEDALVASLEGDADKPYVLNYLGYTWADRSERLAEALDLIERAVGLAPGDGMIIDSLGWVLYRLERYEEAVTHLERAVALVPLDPVINDHLGDAYWMVGRRTEARFQWQRVLTFESDDDALIEAVRHKLQSGLDERGI